MSGPKKAREAITFQESSSHLQKKGQELTENLSVLKIQVTSTKEKRDVLREEYGQVSWKGEGRWGKFCSHC